MPITQSESELKNLLFARRSPTSDWSGPAKWTNESNKTCSLPVDMCFNDGHLLSIIVYR